MTEKKPRKKRKRPMLCLLEFAVAALAIAVVLGPVVLCRRRPLPPGTRLSRPAAVASGDVELLIDSTRFDTHSEARVIEQEIFDAVLADIRDAHSCILVDFFLWNSWQGAVPEDHRPLSAELSDALVARKRRDPEVRILVLTDPINRVYGHDEDPCYRHMADAGIPVVFTDLDRLPESNLLYAPYARVYGGLLNRWAWFRREAGFRRVAHPFDARRENIGLAQFARLLRFKANHRKVLVTDSADGEWCAIVSSLNPADGSSAHSNMGLRIAGDMAVTIAAEELAAVEWSAENPACVIEQSTGHWRKTAAGIRAALDAAESAGPDADVLPGAEWLTEGAIRDRVLTMLNEAGQGDAIRIAMFYLSDRCIVQAIKDAAYGGARVRLLLDPNRDAFGRIKNGVPNRPVAHELMTFAADSKADLEVRWALTHGEQFHTKAMSVTHASAAEPEFICGSANWTRRNLADLNLEGNVFLAGASNVVDRFNACFDGLWRNEDGMACSAGYEAFAETGWSLWRKTWLYRFQEASGMSTF